MREYLRIPRAWLRWAIRPRDDRTGSRVAILLAFSLTGILAILTPGSFRLDGVRKPSSVVPVAAHKAIVVAELFTSEGCSSCPPADEILSRLVQQQPMANVTVLGLSENVDYWNRLGWVDPFSSPAFSQRQSEYAAHVFRNSGVYTPQIVIDGSLEEVGSDAEGVYRKIAQAAKLPKADMNLAATLGSEATSLQIQVEVEVPPEVIVRGPANVILAITENNLTSNVHRGENNGRLLRHNAMVRSLETVGDIAASTRVWSKTTSVSVLREWKPENLKVIGFLQQQQSRRIIGAGWSTVRNQAATQ
jgi:hypothetical protein